MFLLLLDQEREREVRKERARGRKRKRAGAVMVLLMAVAAPADSLRWKNTGEEEVLGRLGWRRSRRGVAAGWWIGRRLHDWPDEKSRERRWVDRGGSR